MDFQIVKTIAAQEFRIHVRSKWTLLFGLVFGTLALAISYFGLVTTGLVGFQGFTRTSASLLNLVIYLVPLMSLIMGALAFTGERGAAELLFSQPVMRSEVLLGRLWGLFVSVTTAICFGFGMAGAVIALNADGEGSLAYMALVGLTLLLALVFLSLGTMVAVVAQKRAKAFGYTLFLWFFFVLFYDLLVMGVAFLLNERLANFLIFLSLFGNPADMVRVSALIAMGGTSIFGAAGALLIKFFGGMLSAALLLVSTLLVWFIGPIVIANRVLKGQDI